MPHHTMNGGPDFDAPTLSERLRAAFDARDADELEELLIDVDDAVRGGTEYAFACGRMRRIAQRQAERLERGIEDARSASETAYPGDSDRSRADRLGHRVGGLECVARIVAAELRREVRA